MSKSNKIYFIHNGELFAGQLIRKKDRIGQVRTFTTEEVYLDIPQEQIFGSFKEADNFFQKKFPEKDIDLDTLMDTARFLDHSEFE